MGIQNVEGGRLNGVEGAVEEDCGEEGAQDRWRGGALDALSLVLHPIQNPRTWSVEESQK